MKQTELWEQKEPKFVRQMTVHQFEEMFPNEIACCEFLLHRRWPNGVRCARCNNDHVYASKARPWHWQCKKCGKNNRAPYRFSLKTGTIFEETKHPLLTWFNVLHLMVTSKKGISALQIHRMLGFGSYRTAWYMCMRLRAGMADPDFRHLMGIVEIDETFIGGKEKNKHLGKRNPENLGGKGKAVVIGAISRKGNLVCQMIETADRDTMMRFVQKTVARGVDLVVTDEHKGYDTIVDSGRPHEVIRHSDNVHVRGIVHTNSIEGFWALLKRGIIGTYHNVSRKFLPLYLNEFQFRYNNRKEADIFGKAIAGC
jgi:transposase-like protein